MFDSSTFTSKERSNWDRRCRNFQSGATKKKPEGYDEWLEEKTQKKANTDAKKQKKLFLKKPQTEKPAPPPIQANQQIPSDNSLPNQALSSFATPSHLDPNDQQHNLRSIPSRLSPHEENIDPRLRSHSRQLQSPDLEPIPDSNIQNIPLPRLPISLSGNIPYLYKSSNIY